MAARGARSFAALTGDLAGSHAALAIARIRSAQREIEAFAYVSSLPGLPS